MPTNYGTNSFALDPNIGINVYPCIVDDNGYILYGKFDTLSTPPTTTLIFQKGCIMVKTDAADTVKACYENVGTLAAPSWNLLGDVSTGDLANGSVTLAKLATGVAPSHVVKFAGQPTTVGGAAAEAFTVTGALSTDLAFVQIVDNGTANVTALQAVVTANTLTVTFSADPGADTVINYQILRAAV